MDYVDYEEYHDHTRWYQIDIDPEITIEMNSDMALIHIPNRERQIIMANSVNTIKIPMDSTMLSTNTYHSNDLINKFTKMNDVEKIMCLLTCCLIMSTCSTVPTFNHQIENINFIQ